MTTEPRILALMSIILVMGMHRSGTSCLAACLQSAVGKSQSILWGADNPGGHYETEEVLALSDEVLHFSGTSWKSSPSTLKWTDEHSARRDALAEQWAVEPSLRVIKDPRLCITWHFWEKAFQSIPAIGTFRHPLAVLDSFLTRGDDASQQEILELWLASAHVLLNQATLGMPLVEFGGKTDEYLNQLEHALRNYQSSHSNSSLDALSIEKMSDTPVRGWIHHQPTSWNYRDLNLATIESAKAAYDSLVSLRAMPKDSSADSENDPSLNSATLARGGNWRQHLSAASRHSAHGEAEAAAKQLHLAEKESPNPDHIRRRWVELLLDQGHNEQALEICEEVLNSTSSLWWRLLRAKCLLAQGKRKSCLHELDALLDEHAKMIPAARLRLLVLANGNEWKRILAVADPLLDNAAPWVHLEWQSIAALHLGDEEEAASARSKALRSAPKAKQNEMDLRWATALAATGKIDIATDIYNQQLAEPKPSELAYIGFATLLRDAGKPAEAYAICNKACPQYPESLLLHLLAAQTAGSSGNLEARQRYCRQAAAIAPKHPAVLELLAQT